jgi:F-type H+-transporting ATPase subunit b
MDKISELLSKFGVNGEAFLAAVINFTILLFILHRFAYKPLLAVLEERKQKIAESLKQADAIKAELAKAEAAREEIMTKANASAQRMIDEARLAADKFRDDKLGEATRAAQELLRKAQDAGRMEREKAMVELRKEMVGLVVATTAKVTGKILTQDDQKRLSEETLQELAA